MARIGWIGTGVMGLPMASHILDAGHDLIVHSRTESKARPLIENGARWASSPGEAAEGVDVVFSMVSYPDDIQQVHLGKAGTLSSTTKPGIIVDMTSGPPDLAVRIASAARESGVGCLDAPVSGSDIGAIAGSLSIMVGGPVEDFRFVRSLFELMGDLVIHHGPAGAGQRAKIVNQTLLSAAMLGVCEGLTYAESVGLDLDRVIKSVGFGAAGSWAVKNLGPKIAAEDMSAGFFSEHLLKDLSIALEEARSHSLPASGLDLCYQLYSRVVGRDLGRAGIQALIKVVRGVEEA